MANTINNLFYAVYAWFFPTYMTRDDEITTDLEMQAEEITITQAGTTGVVSEPNTTPFPSPKTIIGLSFVTLTALLGISYLNNNNKATTLAVSTISYLFMLLSVITAVSASMAGVYLGQLYPRIAEVFGRVAVLSLITQFSVLAWVLLPVNLKWVACVCTAFLLLFVLAPFARKMVNVIFI